MKNKKIINICLISLSAALFLAAAVFIILLNIPRFYPAVPQIVENNGKIYVQTSKNESGYGYIFKFTSENDSFTIENDLNILDISELYKERKQIIIGQSYDISVAFKGEISGGNSPFSSPVSWIAKTYLQAPTITEADGRIVWQQVPLADRYRIYYSDKDIQLIAETSQTFFELKNLVGGMHNIFITALSSSEYRMESAPSNILEEAVVVHEIAPLQNAEYFSATGMLFVYSREKINAITLKVNEKQYNLKNLSFSKLNSIYVCSVDISMYAGATMQVCPASSDAYNVYNGEMLQVRIN